jgi:hypothetical protein
MPLCFDLMNAFVKFEFEFDLFEFGVFESHILGLFSFFISDLDLFYY